MNTERVTVPAKYLADFCLAERCLEHDPAALRQLQEANEQPVTAYLLSTGATAQDVKETVTMLWGDLLTPTSTGRRPLSRYNGTCLLFTFVSHVALGRLYDRRKVRGRRDRRFPASETETFADPADAAQPKDESLTALIRDAVRYTFQNCAAKNFVVIQLLLYDGLKFTDLAHMFQCSESTMRRDMESAQMDVQTLASEYVRKRDPWLELKWEDFVELCRTTTLTGLGIDEEE